MQTGRNPYDIRLQCEEREPERCYDFSYIRDYLNAERVHEYLHVQTDRVETWETCNMQVKMQFTIAGDPLKSVISYVKELLENNVRVLIYAGDADLMCNWYGIQAWTNALDWSGKKTFNAAPEHSFITNDLLKKKSINAGMAKSNGKLTFVRVYNAGHLVPKDQPAVALDMINRFLKNETF
jgi:carboxypeptidase C (cathepsin A)